MKLELLKNLDKMIWKDISKMGKNELDQLENEWGISFPEEDRKYLKCFDYAKGINIIFRINEREFYVNGILGSTDYIDMLTENYFEDRKLISLIKYDNFFRIGEIQGNIIAYDFSENLHNPDIIYISYIKKDNRKILETPYNFELLYESIKEVKVGKRIKDLFKYMYITNEKQEDDEAGYIFKCNTTDEELDKFQKELGIKFPEKYLELLIKARKGIRQYPMQFVENAKQFEDYGTGIYLDFNSLKERYDVFLNEYSPYPKKLIPILETGDSCYCLDYRNKNGIVLKEPKITYFDTGKVRNKRFIHIAESYDEFLRMRQINKEEVEKQNQKLKEKFFGGNKVLEMIKGEE